MLILDLSPLSDQARDNQDDWCGPEKHQHTNPNILSKLLGNHTQSPSRPTRAMLHQKHRARCCEDERTRHHKRIPRRRSRKLACTFPFVFRAILADGVSSHNRIVRLEAYIVSADELGNDRADWSPDGPFNGRSREWTGLFGRGYQDVFLLPHSRYTHRQKLGHDHATGKGDQINKPNSLWL